MKHPNKPNLVPARLHATGCHRNTIHIQVRPLIEPFPSSLALALVVPMPTLPIYGSFWS